MTLARTHRRLAILMSLASLLAFAGGAGVQPLTATLAAGVLLLAFFWQPDPDLSSRIEKIGLPLALLLVARALFHFFVIREDVVVPVVDLLFLLLAAESIRSLEAKNDVRIYSLSAALLLASTAYRPGLLFLVAFVAYTCLATVVLMVGHLRREFERHGTEGVTIPRSFLLSTPALSAVILGVAVLVFLTFPRVSQGWAGRGETTASSMAGFADEVTLGSHGSRIYGNPRIVLRVEFRDGAPGDLQSLYWRGRSYDRFDGIRWSRSRRIPPSQAPSTWYERWGGDVISQRIYGAPLEARILFALHPLLEIETESQVQPIRDNAGDHLYWGSGPPGYTAYSISGRPSPEELRTAQGGFVPARDFYTQVPPLSQEVLALADSLLASLPTDYDRALALERWFRNEFTYTLDLPRTAREATLEHFLLGRRAGHCEYFSTAMAVLLRTQGVVAREVNGFLGGSWSPLGDYLAVTQNEAHAWVEVWFPGYGWVPFDPTPPGRGEAIASSSWFWPGRFMVDALQHRWNKWVLDYSFQTQFSILEKSREWLRDASAGAGEPESNPLPWVPVWMKWVSPFMLLALLALVWSFRRDRGKSQETRMYLRLKGYARRAGAPSFALRSPCALPEYLQSVGHPAAQPTRDFIQSYLRARFSGLLLTEEERDEMIQHLRNSRSRLRQRIPPGEKNRESD